MTEVKTKYGVEDKVIYFDNSGTPIVGLVSGFTVEVRRDTDPSKPPTEKKAYFIDGNNTKSYSEGVLFANPAEAQEHIAKLCEGKFEKMPTREEKKSSNPLDNASILNPGSKGKAEEGKTSKSGEKQGDSKE